MKTGLLPFLLGAAVLAACSGAHAQSVEAQRYMGSQGIEIIQNRSAPVRRQAVAAAPSEGRAGGAEGVHGAPAQAGSDSRLLVAPATQAARDRDRLAILQQELVSEASVYQTKAQLLQNPARMAKLAADEIAGLKAQLIDHEKNIRALNTEIGRMKPPR